MNKEKEFPIEVVISAASGILCSDFSSVHELIEFVMDRPIWTHEIPRIADAVADAIYSQHPQLKNVDTHINKDNLPHRQIEWRKHYGNSLSIQPFPSEKTE